MASRDLADLGYRRIVILLVSLVIIPTFLLVSLGVILLFLGEAQLNLLMGILVMVLSGAAVTGVILVWVFVRREASLSRLQSDFVSKVSHELKTPLTSIRLFSETLAMRRGDPTAEQKCIEGLERETTRLQELIDRLLDWGRMESGMREFVIRETDLKSIIDNALDAFETHRQRRSVDLSVQIPRETLRVWADRGAVSDALLNLLTNAYKYGGDPVKVSVTVEELPS
ncbi:MAG TPA: HAMP domain-containing sensor histidine kinase, partial [Polyangiaceae bacterium]|nr:HAMP domain-containing sensor histidine kinase [Polyangiaceae bacterium]